MKSFDAHTMIIFSIHKFKKELSIRLKFRLTINTKYFFLINYSTYVFLLIIINTVFFYSIRIYKQDRFQSYSSR